MKVTSGNSGNNERDSKGPSGLPVPGGSLSSSELRRRASSFFDREMGPAETLDFQARLTGDDRVLREFEATRRAIEHLKTGRPAPDLTGSILDEVERRRRLLGGHRHARRRVLRGLATSVGAVALMAMVLFGVDSILTPPAEVLTSVNRPAAITPLVAVPSVSEREADRPVDALALQLRPPVDASRDLRWDISSSPLLLAGAADIGLSRSALPIETGSWTPLGSAGVWPTLFPNASVTRPPMATPLIDPGAPFAVAGPVSSEKDAGKEAAAKEAGDKAAGEKDAKSAPKSPAKPVAKPASDKSSPATAPAEKDKSRDPR